MLKWFWEQRSNTEYVPPQVATFLQGWTPAKADMKSAVEPGSEVFVRELVQNFIDASNAPGVSRTTSSPTLHFRFVTLRGESAKSFFDQTDMVSISSRYQSFTPQQRAALRLPSSSVLGEDGPEIELLVVTESGTCGMSGPWDRSARARDESGREIVHRMRDALLATVRGYADKGLGAYGEGKKAVIGISAPRTLFAYTCFDPSTTDDGASRRFMGGVYWQNHEVDNMTFSGFAMIGDRSSVGTDGRPRPFANELADEVVSLLNLPGLELRSPERGETGTTYVFVEPKITPLEVAESLARNWWPSIVDNQAEFRITDEQGQDVPVVFSENLTPFINAYRATHSKSVEDWNSSSPDDFACDKSPLPSSLPETKIGDLSLALNLYPVTGWSRKDPDTNQSIVALIRDGMVISYQHFPRSGTKLAAPFVRGTFTVRSNQSPEAAEALRLSEPPLHNKWDETNRDLDESIKKTVKSVYKGIQERLYRFREQYVSAAPSREVNLALFQNHLSLGGSSRTGKTSGPSMAQAKNSKWSMLNDVATLEAVGDRRKAKASRVLKLANSSTLQSHSLSVLVEVGWEILEDGVWREANFTLLHLPIEVPDGWSLQSNGPLRNQFLGQISDIETKFAWESEPYRELWTLRPYMKVTEVEMPNASGEGGRE